MGFSNGTPTISTDGLVFAVDAGNGQSYVTASLDTFSLVSSTTGSLKNDTGFSSDNQGSWVFDGVDDYIDCEDISTLNAASTLSLSFWCKKATGDNLGAEAFITGTDKVILYWWTNDTVFWGVRNTGTPTAASSALADFSIWHHFVGTYEGSSGTIKLYVDGSLVNTQTGAPSSTTDLSSYFKIGKANGTSFGTGQISNVQIYSKSFTSSEVLQNYNATKGRFT